MSRIERIVRRQGISKRLKELTRQTKLAQRIFIQTLKQETEAAYKRGLVDGKPVEEKPAHGVLLRPTKSDP